MLPKSMHHCAFLIITFSFSYILCIQNGKTVSSSFPSLSSSSSTVDKLESRHFDFPLASESQPRQSFFQQNDIDSSGFQPSTGPTGFRFPDKHQYTANTNSPNELMPSPPFGYSDPYLNNRELPNTNQQPNPHNLALNTGEQSSPAAINSNANNLNNYPYQQHANAIPGLAHHYHPTPNVPNANDFYLSRQQFPSQSPLYQHLDSTNPYYPTPAHPYQPIQRRPTYAQGFGNYLFNGAQPNYYNRPRATPPPRPPPPSQPSNDGFDSSYRPYQDGHYPYNDLTSPSGPSTYPPQYANQFGNFGSSGSGYETTSSPSPASSNPLGSLLSSFGVGGPFAGGNPLSMQIIRGLENIARNDDLQCVPKVLCQMLGSPTRRAQLPSFITSPVLTRFVASLPSLSPALIFARAALLGLSGGEYSCARTYNKCPQDEDEILFYLNNHRGGFFKFFSEPDSHNQQDTEYTTQPPKGSSYQQQSEPSIFNFLTGLTSPTSSSSSSSNTNQGNVNSFMGEAVTNGIGSLFGNIISGFLSGQGQGQSQATRRKDDEHDIDEEKPEKYSDLIESNSTTTNSDVNNDEESDEQVEGRILNNKSNILAAYVEPESSVQHDNPISFPPDNDNGNDNYDAQQFQSEFRFPNTPHRDDFVSLSATAPEDSSRKGKRVNFIDDGNSNSESFSQGTKMIFPDRTGTGNLRFDNDEYFRVGKILNRRLPLDYSRGSYRETTTTTTRRPTNYYSSHNSGGFDRYSSSNYYRKDYVEQEKRDEKEDTSGNVYVTNGQGVIEYYINASGKKVYV